MAARHLLDESGNVLDDESSNQLTLEGPTGSASVNIIPKAQLLHIV